MKKSLKHLVLRHLSKRPGALSQIELLCDYCDALLIKALAGRIKMYGRRTTTPTDTPMLFAWTSVVFGHYPSRKRKWEVIPPGYWENHRIDLLGFLETGRLGSCTLVGEVDYREIGINFWAIPFYRTPMRVAQDDSLEKLKKIMPAASGVHYWRSFWQAWKDGVETEKPTMTPSSPSPPTYETTHKSRKRRRPPPLKSGDQEKER
jgi:hypothetical protein